MHKYRVGQCAVGSNELLQRESAAASRYQRVPQPKREPPILSREMRQFNFVKSTREAFTGRPDKFHRALGKLQRLSAALLFPIYRSPELSMIIEWTWTWADFSFIPTPRFRWNEEKCSGSYLGNDVSLCESSKDDYLSRDDSSGTLQGNVSGTNQHQRTSFIKCQFWNRSSKLHHV